MILETSRVTKTIADAVAEGSLIDVSDIAKKFQWPYRMFITPLMFERFKAFDAGRDNGLEVRIGHVVLSVESGPYGPEDNDDYESILEPHEEYGHVILVAERGKLDELRLKRIIGNRNEHIM